MAITNGYATLAEIKAHIDPKGNATWAADEETLLERAVEAASRWIDERTGCRFYASAETRYYTATFGDLLYIDDLISVTTLKTDENDDGTYEVTWDATDYHLEPRNAALESRPYRQIRTTSDGDYSFPTGVRYGVELVGSFGYAATAPTAIKQACLLLAQRLWKRREAIFGVAGSTSFGVAVVQAHIQRDGDILALLEAVDRRGW